MISLAWSVFECEQLFANDPAALTESKIATRSDWTLACVAEGLALAAEQLGERGRTDAAQRVRLELRAVLQHMAKSSLRSPGVSYGRVLSALVYDLPSESLQD